MPMAAARSCSAVMEAVLDTLSRLRDRSLLSCRKCSSRDSESSVQPECDLVSRSPGGGGIEKEELELK